MRLEPFNAPGSTDVRREFWRKAYEAALTIQKYPGRNVTIDERKGYGTIINVRRDQAGTPVILTGACCSGEWPTLTCSTGTAEDCAGLGGHYLGDGSTCDGVDCNSGACCSTTGDCSDTLDFLCGDCAVGHSCWMGYGTTCADTRCTGSCCVVDSSYSNGLCYSTLTYAECAARQPPLGSFSWVLNGTCDSQGCCYLFGVNCPPVTGACCSADGGTCTDGTTQESCETGGGTYYAGALCADIDCFVPPEDLAAECNSEGVCSIVPRVGRSCPAGDTCCIAPLDGCCAWYTHDGITYDCVKYPDGDGCCSACGGPCFYPDYGYCNYEYPEMCAAEDPYVPGGAVFLGFCADCTPPPP